MDEITALSARLGQELLKRNITLATAESCTGGGIANAITDIAGSSQWFECGYVTYSNASKTAMLSIPASLIGMHGAVSSEVAAAMSQGAISASKASLAVSTTGIAGPGGGSDEKPVGTVWFGLTSGNHTHTEVMYFSGNRQEVRKHSVKHALSMLLAFLGCH